MDRFVAQRRALVERIRDRGIMDPAILQAFMEVPRHEFVPEAVRHRAYEDAPLPIGFGQTASQPSLQALYMQHLDLKPADRVLEIGTGSGYQTAVLARLVDRVYSMERVAGLSQRARGALDALRVSNVALLVGDGTVGWSRYAPFDAILVAAGSPEIPSPLLEQLADGGRMLVPVGTLESQRLHLVRKSGEEVESEEVLDCTFVPLLGRFGWSESGSGRGDA
jgi:protein-L-isoaspartate(D-aspartate) O-methyltransferase